MNVNCHRIRVKPSEYACRQMNIQNVLKSEFKCSKVRCEMQKYYAQEKLNQFNCIDLNILCARV